MIICKSCNANIPPEWVAAINSGICPGCGNDFWSESDRGLLLELRNAMEKMVNADAASIVGWLLSNYQLRKIGTAEPTSFHRKNNTPTVDDTPKDLKIAKNPKSIFLQRAGVDRELSRRENLAALASQINNAGDEPVSVDLDELDDYEDIDEHEAVALRQSQQTQGGLAKKALANNSLFINGGLPPPSLEEAAELARSFGGRTQAINDDLPPALQADRFKRLQAQEDLAGGGKPGSFSRRS